MKTKRYTNITPSKFDEMRGKLRANNISVPDGHSGRITISKPAKVLIDFGYDGTDVLELTVVDKPFLASYDRVWKEVDPFLT
jgi:hypothetical protein